MMNRVYGFFLLMVCTLMVQAQEKVKVTGRLIDENSQPVVAATIKILETLEDTHFLTGGISDEEGAFIIEKAPGKKFLVATAIGYQQVTISCNSGDLGDLQMHTDTEMLDEVTVTANRVQQKNNGVFVSVPDQQEVDRAGRGLNLLAMQQLPGLRVDRAKGVITVDGGSPILQINGKEVASERLANLNPSRIKRIEYSNNPGIRYIDRGATGIINIILKDADDGGTLITNLQTPYDLTVANAYVMGAYNKGKNLFSLEYSLEHRDYDKAPTHIDDKFQVPQRTVVRKVQYNAPFNYDVHNINTEYTYQYNDSTMFIASLTQMILDRFQGGTGTINITDRGVTRELERIRTNSQNQYAPKLDLFFSKKLPHKQKIEMNVVGELNTSKQDNMLIYVSSEGKEEYPTLVDNNGWALSAEGVYSKQWGDVRTRWGVQYQHNYAKNDYKVYNTISRMTKDNTYVFGEIQGNWGEKVMYTLGTGAKILRVDEKTDAKTFVRNLTTARLNWRMNDSWSLTGTLAFDPQLPSLSQMSNVLQRTDDVSGTQGNRNLKPAENLNVSSMLNFNKNGWFVNTQLGYFRSFHAIFNTVEYNANEDLFINRAQNANYASNFYGGMEVGRKGIANFMNIILKGYFKIQQSKGEGFSYHRNNFNSHIDVEMYRKNLSWGGSFTLTPEWALDGEILSRMEKDSQLFVQWNVNPHLTLGAVWLCPFNNDGFKYEMRSLSPIYSAKSVNWTSRNGNQVLLSLSWNTNFGKAFHKGEKTLWNGGYDSGVVR